MAGEEVAQLYVSHLGQKSKAPIRALKEFTRLSLQPGESKEVKFAITPEDLKFYNYDLNHVWEAGDFDIMIGTNSAAVKMKRVNWSK